MCKVLNRRYCAECSFACKAATFLLGVFPIAKVKVPASFPGCFRKRLVGITDRLAGRPQPGGQHILNYEVGHQSTSSYERLQAEGGTPSETSQFESKEAMDPMDG